MQSHTRTLATARDMLMPLALLLALVGLVPVSSPETEDRYIPPRGYVCFRADDPSTPSRPAAERAEARTTRIKIDGRLDELAWQLAPWTDEFVDIEGDRKPRPRFRTRAKMLWDDDYFYIAAEVDEPHVWATLTKHDSVIFHDNDFEVFIDPDGDSHNYGEFEINALNTGWDLRLPKPYKDGGTADDGWEITGLKTAVHVDGSLNDASDTDGGWTIEMAIPWSGLAALFDSSVPVRPARRDGPVFVGYEVEPAAAAGSRETRPGKPQSERPAHLPPKEGDQWRVNFSRVEWLHEIADGKYEKVPNRREDNWVWSPQGVINMHRPETWGYVQFSSAPPGSDAARKVRLRHDAAAPAKYLLHRVYYAQHEHHKKHGRFAVTLDALGLGELSQAGLAGPLKLDVAAGRFEVTCEVSRDDGSTDEWHIREDARVCAKRR